jgi:cell division protein FtsL
VALLLLVGILVGCLVLYAWPHFQMRQTAMATEQMQRERDRLVEENRKLRLEKASLESLARVQVIAEHHLGLTTPAADHLVVVDAPAAPATGERADLGSTRPAAAEARN